MESTKMNRTYLISIDNVKTFCQGAFGAMAFHTYHMFVTTKISEMENKNQQLRLQAIEQQQDADMKRTM
jgi:hypothetical protein